MPVSRTQQSRTQTTNLDEKYQAYLASNGEPEDDTANPLNLFDELNGEDMAWFTVAKIYINQNTDNSLRQALVRRVQSL